MTEDLRQAAQQYLKKVRPTGNENVMAICPFHRKADGSEEKGASFAMNIYNGLWFCHSCHARGNLYTFLRDIGLSRADIEFRYKALIEEAEHHAPQRADPLHPIEPTKELLDESFLGLFDFCPQLLLDEGYPEELLRKFSVGFDEKHQRITFPLRDLRGRLCGISGRSVDGKEPRYKVYDKEYLAFGLPERKTEKRALVWNMHDVLIQLDFEKDPGARFVVVVEGFKAVMRVAQSGISGVVGLLGSHMAQEQQWALEGLGCPVLLMLDNNPAGRKGQHDAAMRLLKTVQRLHVVEYAGDQPSDLSTQDIVTAVSTAPTINTWLLKQHAPLIR